MAHSVYDRLLMGSPLRRSGVGKAITAALLVILAFATLVQLAVFTGMPPGLFSVFLRALALSSLLALVPLAMLGSLIDANVSLLGYLPLPSCGAGALLRRLPCRLTPPSSNLSTSGSVCTQCSP